MKVINFGKKADSEVIIIQPLTTVSGYRINVKMVAEDFLISIGCQENVRINKDNIDLIMKELSGDIKATPKIIKCIVRNGDKMPTESKIQSGYVEVLAEETEKYYISEREKVFKKAADMYIIVDVKTSPMGTYFSKTKEKLYWVGKYPLTSGEVTKIMAVLQVIKNYYSPSEEPKV